MATSMARSGLRSASLLLRDGVKGKAEAAAKRSFSASAHDVTPLIAIYAGEASKWEKITYAGIATCTILAFYNLFPGYPHHEEPAASSYLHIRNKEFPWGPDGLFEKKHPDH